ncbi:MAG: hypothetical protein ACD_18C00132G0002, partial [uncultured bacterium]
MGRDAVSSSKLEAGDATLISQNVEHIKSTTVFISGNSTVAYGQESGSLNLFGIYDTFFEIGNLELETGRLLSEEDLSNKSKVVVIGSGALTTLFGEEAKATQAVGQSITVANKKMEIVGVLKENGGSAMGRMSYDDAAFTPYSTAESILGNQANMMIVVLMDDVDNLQTGMDDITSILRVQHKLKASQADDFRIFDPGSIVGAAQSSANTMSLLLVSIATIVLIVSGVGIMNVMFVTVAERTKEIGIAKAIGAQKQDILTQFLAESVILSIGGGMVGAILGQVIIPILNKFEGWYVVPSFSGVILAFTFSAAVGLFFGFYPALKASKLDPVDALRSE